MKHNATKFSIPNLIVFLVFLFFGVSAHARLECQIIEVPTTGGCGSVNMCSSGKIVKKEVCFEVPDTGPLPGGSGSGQSGPGGPGGGGGGSSLEDQAKKDTEAKKKELQDKYCKAQPAAIALQRDKCVLDAIQTTNIEGNRCSNFSFSLSWILGASYSTSCRSYWAGEKEARVQQCNVLLSEATVALSKECP